MDDGAKADFFISRAGADKGAAELIAEIIREAGLAPFYQDEHFGHADFMRMMEQGFESGAKLVALLSGTYQKSEHCRKEYNTFLAGDPGNLNKRVIVFRVTECQPIGNLATLAYTDLVPVLHDRGALRRVVRVALGFDKRATETAFAQTFQRAGLQILHPDIKPVKGFTGREDLLEALSEKLAAKSSVAIHNSAQTSVALRGLGGVGKTVLAQEFAWRNRSRYCGVWWVRAETPETLVDDLVALGSRIIPGLGDMKPEDAALATVDRVTQMHTEKPWLLVFDNADDPAPLRKFTPGDNAHVLITTRRTGWRNDTDAELAVDVFDRETAIAFLMEVPLGDREAAGRLADALDRLPLALDHARAYCEERNWPFDRYISLLPELIKQAPPHSHYPAPVFATFSLAIERAAARSAEAETLMALLAFFAADQVPLWLIPEDVLSETQASDALAALNAVSLVRYDDLIDGTQAVSVHRLVQEVMRGRLRAAGQFEQSAALAIQRIERSFDDSGSFKSASRNAAWFPHALACLQFAPESGAAAWHTLWTLFQSSDYYLTRGETSAALEACRKGQETAERLAKADPSNAGWQRDLSVGYEKVGDVLAAQGALAEALSAYRDSLAIAERLAKADPSNAGWQRDLSVGYNKVGDVLAAQGALAEALSAYRDSLAIAERLAKADPSNAGWQRDLSVGYNKVGDVLAAQGALAEALTAYRDSLAIAERLAKADPSNAGWQRDLSVGYNKVGDVLRSRGALAEALSAYRDSLAIAERLAKADPSNAGWQRDLSVGYNKVGDVLRSRGALAEALSAYRDSLGIRERLAKADPSNAGWQRDLSVGYNKVGDVLRSRGALAEALSAYRDSLAIAERLAKADPSNAGWQRDLSVGYNKVGDVLRSRGALAEALSAYRDSLAIAERLAKADPSNAGWQRDLSVGYNKVGDVLAAQGALAEALTAYRDSLAIAERLAKADPSNAGWQRDLSVGYEKVGDVLADQGALAEALTAYRDSLGIRERLAKADPSNAGWQRDVAMSYERLILMYLKIGESEKAAPLLADGRKIMARLTALSPDNATWRDDLAWFDHYIGEAEKPAVADVTEAREERKRGLFGRLFGGKG